MPQALRKNLPDSFPYHQPFCKFYPQAWLRNLSHLSPAEVGVYTIWFTLYHSFGEKPVPREDLRRACGLYTPTMNRALDALLKYKLIFIVDDAIKIGRVMGHFYEGRRGPSIKPPRRLRATLAEMESPVRYVAFWTDKWTKAMSELKPHEIGTYVRLWALSCVHGGMSFEMDALKDVSKAIHTHTMVRIIEKLDELDLIHVRDSAISVPSARAEVKRSLKLTQQKLPTTCPIRVRISQLEPITHTSVLESSDLDDQDDQKNGSEWVKNEQKSTIKSSEIRQICTENSVQNRRFSIVNSVTKRANSPNLRRAYYISLESKGDSCTENLLPKGTRPSGPFQHQDFVKKDNISPEFIVRTKLKIIELDRTSTELDDIAEVIPMRLVTHPKPKPDGEPIDPDKDLWDRARRILGDEHRGVIGRVIKKHGKPAVLAAVEGCEKERPVDPLTYFMACLRGQSKKTLAKVPVGWTRTARWVLEREIFPETEKLRGSNRTVKIAWFLRELMPHARQLRLRGAEDDGVLAGHVGALYLRITAEHASNNFPKEMDGPGDLVWRYLALFLPDSGFSNMTPNVLNMDSASFGSFCREQADCEVYYRHPITGKCIY